MLTECSQDSFDLSSRGGRKVTAALRSAAPSPRIAGALLLRETDRRIGLTRQVATCFTDAAQTRPREHAVETLLAQRIHGIALGYEDLNDHDELRHDPVLGLVSGKAEARRSDCAVLAGKSTLNRLEHAPKTDDDRYRKLSVDEDAMKRLFVSVFLKSHSTPPERLILDLDATDDPSMAARKAGSSTAITNATAICRFTFSAAGSCSAKLRPANIDASAGAKEEVAFMSPDPGALADVDIWLRRIPASAAKKLMAWCEASRRPLCLRPCPQCASRSFDRRRTGRGEAKAKESGKPERLFKELRYQTHKSWSRERRVVAKAEHLLKGPNRASSSPRFRAKP